MFSRIKLCKLYRHFLNKINYNQRQIQQKNWRKLYIILPPSKIHFSIFSSNFYSCTYILSKQLTSSKKLEDNCFTIYSENIFRYSPPSCASPPSRDPTAVIPLPSSQSTKLRPLCSPVASKRLCILHLAVCMCQC